MVLIPPLNHLCDPCLLFHSPTRPCLLSSSPTHPRLLFYSSACPSSRIASSLSFFHYLLSHPAPSYLLPSLPLPSPPLPCPRLLCHPLLSSPATLLISGEACSLSPQDHPPHSWSLSCRHHRGVDCPPCLPSLSLPLLISTWNFRVWSRLCALRLAFPLLPYRKLQCCAALRVACHGGGGGGG